MRHFLLIVVVIFLINILTSCTKTQQVIQKYQQKDLQLDLQLVKAGSFMMGSRQVGGVHKVILDYYYWIGRTEVTQKQYEVVMNINQNRFKHNDYPVENITWFDASSFCRRLTRQEQDAGRLPRGYVYRLPTEAEWEFAARGGNRTLNLKYAGSNKLDSVGWYGNNSKLSSHQVAGKRSNELGLFDMSGNVAEWCLDWYYKYSAKSVTNPLVIKSGKYRVVRGGGWGNNPHVCTTTYRNKYAGENWGNDLGFRVVLAPSIEQLRK